jgi:hypothetical protein
LIEVGSLKTMVIFLFSSCKMNSTKWLACIEVAMF